MIGPGAIVVCRKTGATAWVAERHLSGGQWKLVSKAVDHRGRAVFSGRIAGEGNVVLIAPAPVYQEGATVEHNGVQHVIAADNGDSITLIVPATRRPLRGGGWRTSQRATRPRSARAI
jgi:hypothetical protein